MTDTTYLLFSTPIYTTTLEDNVFDSIQSEVATAINKTQIDKVASTVETWGDTVRSDFSYHPQDNGQFKNFIMDNNISSLSKTIEKCVEKYASSLNYQFSRPLTIGASWINFYEKHGYQNAHAHAGTIISGCYYYNTNGQDGSIVFENPNGAFNASTAFPLNSSVNSMVHEVPPKQGMLILFPSWLRHRVNVNTTDHTRISIAFNLI